MLFIGELKRLYKEVSVSIFILQDTMVYDVKGRDNTTAEMLV